MQTKMETDLTVRSFAYVAEQVARSLAALGACAQYEQILSEAERHRSALQLAQRDAFETLEQRLREHALTQTEFSRMRESAARTVAKAQQAISLIAERYAPRKMAA